LDDALEYFEGVRLTEGGYLKPRKKLTPDVFVSQATLQRAFEQANALYLCLDGRGHHVVVAPADRNYTRPALDPREPRRPKEYVWDSWAPRAPTVVFVGTVAIGLTLYEISERLETCRIDNKVVPVSSVSPRVRARVWTSMRDLPSGRLGLRAYSPYYGAPWEQTWTEQKPGDLATKLHSIRRALEEAAPLIAGLVEEAARKAEIEHQRWEAAMRERQRIEAEERRLKAIKNSERELFAIVDAWATACRIESIFDAVARRAQDLDPDEGARVLTALERARQLLGGTDALDRFREWKTPEERLAGKSEEPSW